MRTWGRVFGLTCGLWALQVHAGTIFDQFGGTWAPMFSDEVSCAHNPQTITFATDHHSATFAWQSAITFFTGKQERIGRYRIFAASDDRITMAIEGETRLTEGGSTVVWILRLVQDGRAYCWGRTDWQTEQCVAVHFRCSDAIPNS